MRTFNLAVKRERTSPAARRRARFVFFGNSPIDLVVRPEGNPNGAKQSAMISDRLGGPAGNGGPVVLANGISCGAVAFQPSGLGATYCRVKARELGIRMHFIAAANGPPAITVALPGKQAGAYQLLVQRAGDPFQLGLDRRTRRIVQQADVVLIGPHAVKGNETLHGLHALLDSAGGAYTVLEPHPSLVASKGFAALALKARYVQLGRAEAALLDPAVNEMNKHALRALCLLGRIEFAITNGGERGLLWTGQRWLNIRPPQVQPVMDIGLGDAFAAAYAVARGIFAAEPPEALEYAVRASAEAAGGRSISPFFACSARQ